MRLLKSAAALAAASLLLFGCSSNSDSGSSEAAAPEAAVDEEAGLDDNAAAETPPAQLDTGDRAVIYEAALEVEAEDPEAVAEAAWDLAESFGGYVTADERDRAGGVADEAGEAQYSSAHLVLRVPSEQFTEAMDGLVALGDRERHRSVTTEDVTEATVDLAAHIATKGASVDRVRGLLAEATSVNAILELESELAEREGELASLESQLEDLQDRVAMSTIDFLVVTPSDHDPEPEGYAGPDSFWDGLGVGFSGAVSLLVGLSVVIGVLLPFVPLAALAAAAVIVPIRLARKRRGAAPATPAPADAAAGPTGA